MDTIDAPADLGFLIHEPADVYHANRGEYLTSHFLADFRKSPLLYHRKRCGLIPDEDRPAYVVGRAAHTLVLEGRTRFWEEYEVGGPINPKTGQPYGPTAKTFQEWQVTHGKPVLTNDQYNLVTQMAIGVQRSELASELLSDGVPEGVVRTDYCGVACQIRLDWFEPHRGIVDLKTCDDLDWFEADARRFAYGHQLSFYRAVLAQVIGVAMPVFLIAVEKKEPHRCGVWKVTDDTLTSAQRQNEAAIERLKRCLATNDWPTGYEECRVFDHV